MGLYAPLDPSCWDYLDVKLAHPLTAYVKEAIPDYDQICKKGGVYEFTVEQVRLILNSLFDRKAGIYTEAWDSTVYLTVMTGYLAGWISRAERGDVLTFA